MNPSSEWTESQNSRLRLMQVLKLRCKSRNTMLYDADSDRTRIDATSVQRAGRFRHRQPEQRLTYGTPGNPANSSTRATTPVGRLLCAALSLLGVPSQGNYYLYLCSGPQRADGVDAHVQRMNGAPVVLVDKTIGGYAHDLSHDNVAQAVVAAARDTRCLGVLASIPCKTWSASRSVTAGGGFNSHSLCATATAP